MCIKIFLVKFTSSDLKWPRPLYVYLLSWTAPYGGHPIIAFGGGGGGGDGGGVSIGVQAYASRRGGVVSLWTFTHEFINIVATIIHKIFETNASFQ